MNRFEEIKARHQAATPGPWWLEVVHSTVGAIASEAKPCVAGIRSIGMNDAELMASAPADIAYLIAAVEQADEDRRHLVWWRDQYKGQVDARQTKIDQIAVLLDGPPRKPPAEVWAEIRGILG